MIWLTLGILVIVVYLSPFIVKVLFILIIKLLDILEPIVDLIESSAHIKHLMYTIMIVLFGALLFLLPGVVSRLSF